MGAFLYQLANDASSFNPHPNVKASKSEFCLVSSELACFDKKKKIEFTETPWDQRNEQLKSSELIMETANYLLVQIFIQGKKT